MSQKAFSKIWILIIVVVIITGGVLAYKYLLAPNEEKPSEKEEVRLPIPTAPTLSFLSGREPFIQIIWDYQIADYFNIYRATNPEGPWEKITENFPQSAHTAVDYHYPKDAKVLYYRITSVDKTGNESKPSEVSSVNIGIDETADWETYINSEYGYSIKYPENWYVKEDNPDTPGIATIHIIQHTDFSPIRNYDYYKSNAFFSSVIIWDNPSRLSVRDWLKKENVNHPALLLGKIVTVAGKEAIRYEPKGNAYYIEIWLANNDNVYQLFYCEPSKKQEYITIFNQMLSTFRFLE